MEKYLTKQDFETVLNDYVLKSNLNMQKEINELTKKLNRLEKSHKKLEEVVRLIRNSN